MTIHKVQLGERYYKVTKGGYHYIRGIEITEYKKLITYHEELEWEEEMIVLNAQDVESLLGR